MSEDLDPVVVRPISPVVQADLSRLLTISLLIPGREEPVSVQVDGIDVLRYEEWRDVFRVVLSARVSEVPRDDRENAQYLLRTLRFMRAVPRVMQTSTRPDMQATPVGNDALDTIVREMAQALEHLEKVQALDHA